ncbi:hypothetical protein VCSRO60_0040 [Vibrio cholerae]|nr:hypothetical protein VCSRO60_0040 [Vibrio cholerae]
MTNVRDTSNTCQMKSTTIALVILETLFEYGIKGATFRDIGFKTQIPRATLHRYLTSLVDAGWVEACGSKQNMVWKPSNHFIKLAFTYRNAVRAEVDRIGAEFRELTGEDL